MTIYQLPGDLDTVVLQQVKVDSENYILSDHTGQYFNKFLVGRKPTEFRFQILTLVVIVAKLVLLFLNKTVMSSTQAIKTNLLRPIYNKINFICIVVKFFNLTLLSLDGIS